MSYDELMQVLGALEQKVETLVDTVQQLRRERDQLEEELVNAKHTLQETENRLEASQEKLAEIYEQTGSTNSHKEEIRRRISALVDKINQMEE